VAYPEASNVNYC